MKKIPEIHNLLKDSELTKKIVIYFSTKAAGDGFDPYEENYTFTNLNPLTIRGLVRMVSPEALVWKQYGLHEMGALEILTEKRYKQYFESANKIEIEGNEYVVFKDNTGGKSVIQERPNDVLRVILSRK